MNTTIKQWQRVKRKHAIKKWVTLQIIFTAIAIIFFSLGYLTGNDLPTHDMPTISQF